MTASHELINELRASRPVAPARLRANVREVATSDARPRFRQRPSFAPRRIALVAVPAVVVLGLASAGVVGLTQPGGQHAAVEKTLTQRPAAPSGRQNGVAGALAPSATPEAAGGTGSFGPSVAGDAVGPTPGRAQQVTATLTVEVSNSDGVSSAAQDALDVTRSLGGHVVSASVTTGEEGRATLTVRIPVTKFQQAIVSFSALGKITSQQINVDDLQESLDSLTQRAASLRSQIIGLTAKLDSTTLDSETRARLDARRRTLRSELRELRRRIAATNAEARFATVQLTVITPDALGVVPGTSRLHRTLHGALNALVWEGVVALAIVIVVAPLALVTLAVWLGHRLYRRREDERLLAEA
jgi:hypothetical protein